MLKRVYIDNYKCLVNFEFEPRRLNLLLGRNGCGKTTYLEVVGFLCELVTRNTTRVELVFDHRSTTRWEDRRMQSFELDVELDGLVYHYRLQIEYRFPGGKPSINRESLTHDGRPLFSFSDGEAQLYKDDYSARPQYPADGAMSALGLVPERADTRKLTRFKEWCRGVWIVAPAPTAMTSESTHEDDRPWRDMSNFASWYRHLTQEHPGAMASLNAALERVIDGFTELHLSKETRDSRRLKVTLLSELDGIHSVRSGKDYDFDEMSDGQRNLIVLYTLLQYGVTPNVTLCIDGPDNYVGLSEIQPWLLQLRDRVEALPSQVFLISHNPEVIDYLAPDAGILFERSSGGPVRVRRFVLDEDLTAAETLARGWE